MSKHRLFLYLFGGISVVRLLLSWFFGNCFIFQHMWLLYLSYFFIIGIALFTNLPTVPLENRTRQMECIMLGDGTVTQEIFNRRRYRNYTLVCESDQGKAYSSNNGEMIYTKSVFMQEKDGETVVSLVIYTVLYTFIGLYIYELIAGLIAGTIDMNIPINTLKKNLETLNIMSDKYPVRENVEHILKGLNYLWSNLMEMIKSVYELIFD